MKRLLCLLLLFSAFGAAQSRSVRPRIVGAGLAAQRPSTAIIGDIYFCVGSDCAVQGSYWFADQINHWTFSTGAGLTYDASGNISSITTATLTTTGAVQMGGTVTIGAATGVQGEIDLYGTDGITHSDIQVTAGGSALQILGSLVLANQFLLSGDISPTSFGTTQTDYNPTNLSSAGILRLTASPASNIAGLAGGTDGRVIGLCNIGAANINLVNASGTAGNQFALGVNRTILPDACTALVYDSTSAVWRMFAEGGLLIPVAKGGTGTSTNTNHGVMMGQATAAVATSAAGTSRQVFTSGGASADGSYTFPLVLMGQQSGLTCASATTCYTTVFGQRQSAFVTTAGATQSFLVPYACTLANLNVQTLNTNGAQATTFLVEVNSATSTGLTVTSAGLDAAQVYQDNTHTYALTAGDRVYLKITQGSGAASSQIGAVTMYCQ